MANCAIGILLLAQCNDRETPIDEVAVESSHSHLLGGETTVKDDSRKAFTLSARNLKSEFKTSFFVGNSLFNKNWVQAPASATARDGLGPLFVARSCSACHIQDGRGRPPVDDESYVSLLFRVSARDSDGIIHEHSALGGQIQTRSLSEEIKEPDIEVEYETIRGIFDDGSTYTLLKPTYSLAGGDGTSVLSPRVAQAVIGLGLLEAIPESKLKEWADPKDKNKDGISGRMNWSVVAGSEQKQVGRFGWKATQPTLKIQVAKAFQEDIGITSSIFPNENNSTEQDRELKGFPSGGDPEINDKLLNDVVLYCQTLAVPAQRNYDHADVMAGRELFHKLNCNACHISEVTTGDHPVPALAHQTISPFTDLLLHDMGEGLADYRPDKEASGREWRTAPLWGIGLVKTVNKHTRFLHDGRAENIEQAILWHGGEAQQSKAGYLKLTKKERELLLDYLNSL